MDEHIQMHQQEKGLPTPVQTVVDRTHKWLCSLTEMQVEAYPTEHLPG